MSMKDTLLPEFDQEMTTTRRLLERVPGDKPDWKPHVKSFTLAHLAQLVSNMPGWITGAIASDSIDVGRFGGYTNEKTATLLENFDKNVREARAAVEQANDDDYAKPWSLKHGDHVIFTMTRGAVLRQTISHLSHHRGQLTVYLRMLDVPIPSIYGPTADERSF
jgi:uncharacterized damage-inducible protein DinB